MPCHNIVITRGNRKPGDITAHEVLMIVTIKQKYAYITRVTMGHTSAQSLRVLKGAIPKNPTYTELRNLFMESVTETHCTKETCWVMTNKV